MSKGEGKLNNAGGGTQLFTLMCLWYFGWMIGAFVMVGLLGDNISNTAANIRISHMLSGIFLFLIPSTIYAYLYADTKGDFLVKKPIIITVLSLSVLSILTIQPIIETINHYNNLITLPESMSGLQDAFQQMKEASEKSLNLVFADKSPSSLLLNIFVIAIIPGIVEELFFRGCMQRSIMKLSKNTHAAIWITAIIFSILHFQLAGLFPRIVLGALLGYLYAWTKNIWIPILVHVANNAIIVIIQQMLIDTAFYKNIEVSDYSLANSASLVVISTILTATILYFIYKKTSKENTLEQDQ